MVNSIACKDYNTIATNKTISFGHERNDIIFSLFPAWHHTIYYFAQIQNLTKIVGSEIVLIFTRESSFDTYNCNTIFMFPINSLQTTSINILFEHSFKDLTTSLLCIFRVIFLSKSLI